MKQTSEIYWEEREDIFDITQGFRFIAFKTFIGVIEMLRDLGENRGNKMLRERNTEQTCIRTQQYWNSRRVKTVFNFPIFCKKTEI